MTRTFVKRSKGHRVTIWVELRRSEQQRARRWVVRELARIADQRREREHEGTP